uniref:Uncharacterized protein n=1 Tax=Parascaris univalens TaxID=6257 RepID=A0A915C7V9_PARUN
MEKTHLKESYYSRLKSTKDKKRLTSLFVGFFFKRGTSLFHYRNEIIYLGNICCFTFTFNIAYTFDAQMDAIIEEADETENNEIKAKRNAQTRDWPGGNI